MKRRPPPWFWFLLVWLLCGTVALIVGLHRDSSWRTPHTLVLAIYLIAGLGIALLLWQKRRIALLAKGGQKNATEHFEEAWRTSFRADIRRLSELDAGTPFQKRPIHWVLAENPEAAASYLEAGGASELTRSRRHELSGELSGFASWHVVASAIFLTLRTPPNFQDTASMERLTLLLQTLRELGAREPVASVVVFLPLFENAEQTETRHKALIALAETSQMEFPIHLLFEASKALPGGETFFRSLNSSGIRKFPAVRIAAARQEHLPEVFEEAWQFLELDLEANARAIWLQAWRQRGSADDIFAFLDRLASLKDSIQSMTESVCGRFVGSAIPFARSLAVVTSTTEPHHHHPGVVEFDEGPLAIETENGEINQDPLWEDYWRHLETEPLLARPSAASQSRTSRLTVGLWAISLLVSVFITLFALHGFAKGASMDTAWKIRLEKAQSVEWRDSASIRKNLPVQDELRALRQEIREGRPWLLAPGFYRDGMRLSLVEARLEFMDSSLAAQAFAWQERRLRSETQSVRDSLSDTRNLYGTLKAYLLLSAEGWRQGQSKEGLKGLSETCQKTWSTFLGGDRTPLSPAERSTLEAIAQDFAESVQKDRYLLLGKADSGLVERARDLLRSSRNQSGNYARLLSAADALPDLTQDSLGLPAQELACEGLTIPRAFTRRGYLQAIAPTLEEMGRGGADWVLGGIPGPKTGTSASQEMLRELRRRYFQDYGISWHKALQGTTCRLPTESQRIATALATLGAAYDPRAPRGLAALLRRVTEETDLSAPSTTPPLPAQGAALLAKAKSAAEATGVIKDDSLVVALQESFAAVRGLATLCGKGGFDTYFKDLAALSASFSQGMAGDKALTFAKEVSEEDARNPLIHARNEARSLEGQLPPDQRPWFDRIALQPLQQLSEHVGPEAKERLGSLYRAKVLSPWQNLSKGAYPFDSYGQSDASISELDAFLNPRTGTLDTFLQEAGEALAGRASGTAPTRAALEGIRKLQRLQAFFYGAGAGTWKGVQVTATLHADPRAKTSLRVGSQVIDMPAGNGEKRMSFRWPLPGTSGAHVQATAATGAFEEHKDGEWALLKLLESHVTASSSGGIEAVWSFSDRSCVIDIPVSLRLDASGNPFREKNFFQVELPSELFR